MTESKCICCGKEITSSLRDENPWECPCDALRFTGDGTFGSSFYDMIVCPEGEVIQVIICDECLENNKNKIRKMRYTKKVVSKEIE